MKVAFICIALAVTAVSSSYPSWETLVCTANSTCCPTSNNCTNTTITPDCRLQDGNDSKNVTVTKMLDSCNCSQSCTFTVNITDEQEICRDTIVPEISLTLNNDFQASTPLSNSLNVDNITQELIDKLTNCGSGQDLICWLIVGLGGVIILLLIVILILCLAITCLLARGKRYQYTPNVVLTRSSTEQQNQSQEEEPSSQNQDSGGQQPNLYHILDPQYDTVDNKTSTAAQHTSEPVQYCEPEPLTHVQAEATEQKGPTRSGSQPSKLQASLEKIDEQDTGVFYDELTGPGYPKSLKASDHSATSLPTATVPKYSSLHVENGREEEQQKELIPLYSMPDKSKKKEKDGGKKARETELQTLMVRSATESKPPFTLEHKLSGQGGDIGMARPPKSPSPPPPLLPPKPGQASKVAEDTQEDEESTYAEVSSRPIKSAEQRNRTPGAIGTTVSPLHLTSQNPSSAEREKGSFRRSYSMEGYFGSEMLRHQKTSDLDFHQLYDAPMNPSLHTRGMAPHQERQEEEEMEGHGFFRVS